jgi:tRNA nucleotidyltransferase (CCA-adding enzyme)
MHDLGKGVTPAADLPSHPGHEGRGAPLVEAVCARLKAPSEYRDLAVATARFHTHVHRAFELRPGTVVDVLQQCDAFRRPERFAELLAACEFDARGRTGLEARAYPQAGYFAAALRAASAVSLSDAERTGLDGPAIGERIRQARTAAVAAVRAAHES